MSERTLATNPVMFTPQQKRAFSCDSCRKRKVRCNGDYPACNRCSVRGETCIYNLPPPISYTKMLESRIRELESKLSTMTGPPTLNAPPESPVRQLSGSSTRSEMKIDQSSMPATEQYSLEDERTLQSLQHFEGLREHSDGSVSFHGSTSLFNILGGRINPVTNPPSKLEGSRDRLVNDAWKQRSLEQLSYLPDPFQYLLDYHWCWVQPLFNFVYRPAFTRDMKLPGSYYADMVLNAILSHSLRWCKSEPRIRRLLKPYNDGLHFVQQARKQLHESLILDDNLVHTKKKIPIVQTLLLLSGQECSCGNRTQAWLYSGMAFRLIEDMGICIDGQKYSGNVRFSIEEIEIRNRLFWSCYFWDKMISLYLGRSPTIQYSCVSPPRIMLDDSAEIEIWKPHGVKFPPGVVYPPTQAHSISCFMRMCQLAEILNRILIYFYDPSTQRTGAETARLLESQRTMLRHWWDELPDFLRIPVTAIPDYSPPIHIVTLNCLYYTFNILLHRPMLSPKLFSSNTTRWLDNLHFKECISSAESVVALYTVFRRTFGDDHCTLSIAYCIYTAASVFLLEMKDKGLTEARTLSKLMYCVNILEQVRGANSVIDNTLRLIYDELHNINLPSAGPATMQAYYQSQDIQPTLHLPSPSTWSVPHSHQFIDLLNLEMPLSIPSLVFEEQSLGAPPATFDYSNFDMTANILDTFDLDHEVLS